MAWLIVAIFSYFFGAVANVTDKFLLGSKRFSSAPVYAFYAGIFSLGAFFLAPFGLSIPEMDIFLLCLISGFIFALGVLLLYFAIERAEASRVAPVVGAVIPLIAFIISIILGLEKLFWHQMLGLSLLVFGGLLISFDLPLKLGRNKFFSGFYYAFGSGFFISIAYLIFKEISAQESFVTWYVWTRVGCFIGACCLLFAPNWRISILNSFHSAKKNRKQTVSTGGIFVSNKIFGGASTLLFNKALELGSVTLVNALVSVQYVFVILIIAMFPKAKMHIFQEKLLFWDWAQKIFAIVLIAAGIFLIYE